MCFDGEAYVTLYDYTLKAVKNIVKGDEVLSVNGNKAKIICVIKSEINDKIEISNINGALITQWHPIRINNKWVFPYDLHDPYIVYLDYMYNLVLDLHHTVFINDLEIVTLGHNFKEEIVAHPYFGSPDIIKDLKKIPGYSDGLIINLKTIKRSGSYNLVSKVGI